MTVAADNRAALRADARRESAALFGLLLPALLLIGLIVIAPMLWLFWQSFIGEKGEATLANYVLFFSGGSYTDVIVTTLQVSLTVVGICLILGYPLSYLLAQLSDRAAAICMIAVLLPYMTSVLVRTYSWLVLLQRRGMVNKWLMQLGVIDQPLAMVHNMTGTIIGMVHIMLPFLVLPLYASMKAIDRNCMRAASNLGASPVHAFWTVYFPLSLPGLLAGAFMIFVICLGFFVTPAILGGGRVTMMAQQIAAAVTIYSHWGAASALGVALLTATLGILYAADRLMRMHAPRNGASGSGA